MSNQYAYHPSVEIPAPSSRTNFQRAVRATASCDRQPSTAPAANPEIKRKIQAELRTQVPASKPKVRHGNSAVAPGMSRVALQVSAVAPTVRRPIPTTLVIGFAVGLCATTALALAIRQRSPAPAPSTTIPGANELAATEASTPPVNLRSEQPAVVPAAPAAELPKPAVVNVPAPPVPASVEEQAQQLRQAEVAQRQQQHQFAVDRAAAELQSAIKQWEAALAAQSAAPRYTPQQQGMFAARGVVLLHPQRNPAQELAVQVAQQRLVEARANYDRLTKSN